MTSNQVDAVNKCNSRLLFLMSEARGGRKVWDATNAAQIQVLRDYLRFSQVAY